MTAHAIATADPKKARSAEEVRRELLDLIDQDLKRQGIDVYNPLPKAKSALVCPDLIPTTGNVLIPIGRVISSLGTNLRLLKPGL